MPWDLWDDKSHPSFCLWASWVLGSLVYFPGQCLLSGRTWTLADPGHCGLCWQWKDESDFTHRNLWESSLVIIIWLIFKIDQKQSKMSVKTNTELYSVFTDNKTSKWHHNSKTLLILHCTDDANETTLWYLSVCNHFLAICKSSGQKSKLFIHIKVIQLKICNNL